MRNSCVINMIFHKDLWYKEISGVNPLEIIYEKVRKLFKTDEIFYLVPVSLSDDILSSIHVNISKPNIINVEKLDFSHVVKKLYRYLGEEKGFENIVFIHGDSPLLDLSLVSRMLSIHSEQLAEYTHGEGYPSGFLPEILRIEIIPRLIKISENMEINFTRSSIFEVISKDINTFDIETIFAENDLKLRRIEAVTSSWRERLIVENIVKDLSDPKKGRLVEFSYKDFCNLIEKKPLILRPVPTYCQIEITNLRNDDCIYYPIEYMDRKPGQMDLDSYIKIIDELNEINPEIYIEVSYTGEPLLHPNFQSIIKETIQKPDLKLIILTNGLLWTPDLSKKILEDYGETERLFIIFEIDAINEKTYSKIRRGDLFRVERNVRYIHSLGFKNLFVQFTRIDLNEDEMIDFYRTWKSEGVEPIIQKFNDYSGLLQGLSDYDITPLERWPCYHLEREMVIFYNGDVPKCKQDINCKNNLGNLLSERFLRIWKKGDNHYLKHVAGEYDHLCRNCDEYFTFNF